MSTNEVRHSFITPSKILYMEASIFKRIAHVGDDDSQVSAA